MVNNQNEIVIQDTCILLDLVDLSLLEDFFQLDFVVYTTSQVIEEILSEPHKSTVMTYLESGQLKIDAEGTFEAIMAVFDAFSGLSFTDSSVLELAIRRDAVLFSADGSLRNISRRQKVVVRGTLWIVEKLYAEQLITVELAIEKLEYYAEINRRAPRKEIKQMIEKLNHQT